MRISFMRLSRNLFVMAIVAIVAILLAPPCARAKTDASGNDAVSLHAADVTHESPAAPDSEEPHGSLLDPDLGTAFFTIIIFVVLVVILRMTAWKPILAGLKTREQTIRDSIEAAQRAKEDADRSAKDLEAKMAEVQRQAAQQLVQAKADALKVAETIRAQAEAESTALKDRTLRDIDAAKQQALSDINTHAAELGTAVASKILQRQLTVDDQQRLVDESLADLAKKN